MNILILLLMTTVQTLGNTHVKYTLGHNTHIIDSELVTETNVHVKVQTGVQCIHHA